jgi:hypothetical protein
MSLHDIEQWNIVKIQFTPRSGYIFAVPAVLPDNSPASPRRIHEENVPKAKMLDKHRGIFSYSQKLFANNEASVCSIDLSETLFCGPLEPFS